MATKKISEAAAWRECAEFYAAHPKRRFICNALLDVIMRATPDEYSLPLHWPHRAMLHRITYHASDWSTLDRATKPFRRNDARVLFCLLMEIECGA